MGEYGTDRRYSESVSLGAEYKPHFLELKLSFSE
jgi:hypothetical protein